jgi:hypothetical protein
MVKIGKYYAEIIHADTKQAFPEHTAPNGETYVEVEPDSEYWIRIKTDSEDAVYVQSSVDGNSLGYYSVMNKSSPVIDRGLSKREAGKSYSYALKFAKASVRDGSTNGGMPAQFWTGKIEVSFSEAHFTGYTSQRDYSQSWKGGDVSYVMGISDPDKKKGVKSDQGSTFEVKKCSGGQIANYARGGLLQTITLRYCSTLGLIHAGILPKPPMWDLHRLSFAAQSQENVPQPNATVKGENGGKAEVFDLS